MPATFTLPAGSAIAISNGSTPARWYTTREPLDVTSRYRVDVCPVENVHHSDLWASDTGAGWVVYFLGSQTKKTVTPEATLPTLVAFLNPVSKSLKSGACLTFADLLRDAPNCGTLQIKRAAANSRNAGCYYVTDAGPYGANTYYGKIDTDGKFWAADGCQVGVLATLDELEADPRGFVVRHGLKTGRCCFCNSGLEDEVSAKLGYGPVCAKHYDMPRGKKGLREALAAEERRKDAEEAAAVQAAESEETRRVTEYKMRRDGFPHPGSIR